MPVEKMTYEIPITVDVNNLNFEIPQYIESHFDGARVSCLYKGEESLFSAKNFEISFRLNPEFGNSMHLSVTPRPEDIHSPVFGRYLGEKNVPKDSDTEDEFKNTVLRGFDGLPDVELFYKIQYSGGERTFLSDLLDHMVAEYQLGLKNLKDEPYDEYRPDWKRLTALEQAYNEGKSFFEKHLKEAQAISEEPVKATESA